MTNSPAHTYKKSFEDLEAVASKFWPAELSEKEAELSIIPLLIESQDKFINILSVSTLTINNFFTIIEASDLPINIFIKHLVILADFSGEMLQRISKNFGTLFPSGKIEFTLNDSQQSYTFSTFNPSLKKQKPKFSNDSLKITGKKLFSKKNINNVNSLKELQKDVIVLLLFGSSYSNLSNDKQDFASALAKCEIGSYLGKPNELEKFIKQRYIYVSRITGGAQSNTLGQLAQKFVLKYIEDELVMPGIEAGIEAGIEVRSNSTLPNVTHTDPITQRLTSFDIVVTNGVKYVAIEISFQVTTNSVIERKGGQAKARYEQAENAGHKIAYVIDGAGNLQRKTAVGNICSYSHCTVAFTKDELNVLCKFLKNYLSES